MVFDSSGISENELISHPVENFEDRRGEDEV